MRKRCFACYGAVAAVTIAAATVLTACEPAGISVSTTDWSSALEWSQLERAGATRAADPAPADAERIAHRPPVTR